MFLLALKIKKKINFDPHPSLLLLLVPFSTCGFDEFLCPFFKIKIFNFRLFFMFFLPTASKKGNYLVISFLNIL